MLRKPLKAKARQLLEGNMGAGNCTAFLFSLNFAFLFCSGTDDRIFFENTTFGTVADAFVYLRKGHGVSLGIVPICLVMARHFISYAYRNISVFARDVRLVLRPLVG